MAHQCSMLSPAQRESVVRARDAFIQSTRGHKNILDEAKYREMRDINRRTRIAVVQALCDRIDWSDEEDEARETINTLRAKPTGDLPVSGKD